MTLADLTPGTRYTGRTGDTDYMVTDYTGNAHPQSTNPSRLVVNLTTGHTSWVSEHTPFRTDEQGRLRPC
jgi:hypothetical protein